MNKCRPTVPGPHLYREFRAIEIALHQEYVSSARQDMLCYDQRYLDLVGWGSALVCCVIESYRQGHRDRLGDLWFPALSTITEYHPENPTEELWVEWYWKP